MRRVQVVVTCLSIDEKMTLIFRHYAASLALGVSIFLAGPVAATRISWSKENGFIINAEYEEKKNLILALLYLDQII